MIRVTNETKSLKYEKIGEKLIFEIAIREKVWQENLYKKTRACATGCNFFSGIHPKAA